MYQIRKLLYIHTLVPDNLKSAIIKANRYEPDINQVLEDFANHYGTTVTPTRVRKPKDKALVEKGHIVVYVLITELCALESMLGLNAH